MRPENNSSLKNIESERRRLDPIDTSQEDFDDSQLIERTERQIGRIDQILETDNTLNWKDKQKLYKQGCEARLEWLYAKHGGDSLNHNQFNDEWNETQKFFMVAGQHAGERKNQEPQAYWDLATKFLDLRSLQAHHFSRDAQTTLKDTPEEQKARNVADKQMEGVIKDGVKLMLGLSQVAHGESELASDARGKLYELMLINYTRLQTFENDNYDQIMVRSALDREDRPINGYAYPRRSFDMVIQNQSGHNTLVQAKNHHNSTEYQRPIIKIEDHHYGRTLDNLPRHLKDFRLIAENPADPNTRHRVVEAHDRLDAVFGHQLEEALIDSGIVERQRGATDRAAALGQLAVR